MSVHVCSILSMSAVVISGQHDRNDENCVQCRPPHLPVRSLISQNKHLCEAILAATKLPCDSKKPSVDGKNPAPVDMEKNMQLLHFAGEKIDGATQTETRAQRWSDGGRIVRWSGPPKCIFKRNSLVKPEMLNSILQIRRKVKRNSN